MSSKINPSHFVTDGVLQAAFSLFGALYTFMSTHNYTARPKQGVILVRMGDYVKIHKVTSEGIFEEVVRGKATITRRAGLSTSGEARDMSVLIGSDEFIFKGYYEANGLGVGYSGAEENNDEMYARCLHAFIMNIVAQFKSVLGPARSVKMAGDTIATDDIVGQVLYSLLPPGVKELLPNEVEPAAPQIRTAMVELMT